MTLRHLLFGPGLLALALILPACGDSAGGADVAPAQEPEASPEAQPEQTPEATPEAEPEAEPDDPSAWDGTVTIPLGETLYLDGDDYLSVWEQGQGMPVTLASKPEGAEAQIVADGARLTPDRAGVWVLERDGAQVEVLVRDDFLNEDTFLNFNYTPTTPLALTGDAELWVASPPSNAIQRVLLTPEGAQPQELVPTGSWPTAIVHWAEGGYLLVAQSGRDSLGFVNLSTRRIEDALPVGNEPASIVLDESDPATPVAWVALSGQDAVARVDLRARALTDVIAVGHDPRAMVLDPQGGRLFVASLLSDNPTPRGLLQGPQVPLEDRRDIAVIDTRAAAVVDWIHEAGTILRGLWLDPAKPDRLFVTRSVSLNFQAEVAASSRPHAHGLTVVDIALGSETLYEVVEAVELDRPAQDAGPAPSPFTLTPTPDGDHLLLTLSAGNAVLALDPETFEPRARVDVGHDPRGLVFAQGRAWTYAWLDNNLVSFPLPGPEGFTLPLIVDKVEVGDDPTPLDVKEGQRMFNDASFSRHGDFSCNNCHIDGLTDGLVWNILLDGDVNTLAFRNIGGTGPFLWGGQLPTLFDFSREVLRLVGGNATGDQMDLLTTYMQSVTAPPNPFARPGGKHSDSALRGREIFFKGSNEPGGAGCGTCHSGPLFTNFSQVPGKTPLSTDVPSLIGVYDTAPYGRQGQWRTLEEMVQFGVEYTGATLTPEQYVDLTRFVQELPGDLLYLNSASPLNRSRNVHFSTPVALTFSSILRDNQASFFTFLMGDGEEQVEVPGQWIISGRRARFELAEGELALKTRYTIRVKEGLGSILGQSLADPLEVTFETGDIPGADVSGLWRMTLTAAVGSGEVEVAFIQSAGGRVSGTILQSIGGIDLDHIDGYVSGTTLFIEPVRATTPFGDVVINSGEVELELGDRGDYAVRGNGTLHSIIDANVRMDRLSFPDED